jgi:phenylacetic acid degradation protein
MSAVIMDGAVIGEGASVAARAFVKAGLRCRRATLVGGIPARIMRPLSDNEIAWKAEGTAECQELPRRCLRSLRPVEPLPEPEPARRAERQQVSAPEREARRATVPAWQPREPMPMFGPAATTRDDR